jgi:hypothetical protein
MGLKIFRRLFSAVTVAICFSAVLPPALSAAARSERTAIEGYDYGYWLDLDTDECSVVPDGEGGFEASWNVLSPCTMSKRLIDAEPGSADYDISYDMELALEPDSLKDNSTAFVCANAVLLEPFGNLFVTDAYTDTYSLITGDERMEKLGSITTSGGVYDLYYEKMVQSSIGGDYTEFNTYISVRRDHAIEGNNSAKLTGQIDLREHYDAFKAAGKQIGRIEELSLNVEAYNCSGSAKLNSGTIKKAEVVDFLLPGDLNGDMRVDSFDVLLFRRRLVNAGDERSVDMLADMDGNGKVQVNDLVILSNFVLGRKAKK